MSTGSIAVQIFALIGAFTAGFGVLYANGAPQQAAASAMGLAWTVIPYVLFKVSYCQKTLENQKAILAALKSEKSE